MEFTINQASWVMGYHNLSDEQWDNLSNAGKVKLAQKAGYLDDNLQWTGPNE